MSRRNYDQHCGAAAALDAIGDRWTLLIVRDLLLGPLRYTDLLNSLKGIGTDALADRLRRLEQLGAVTKKAHDPPYVSITYQLTERGELLAPAIKALAEFGMALLDDPIETRARHYLGWALLTIAARYSGEPIDADFEFRTGQGTFHIHLAGGTAVARRGPAPNPPSVVLEADDALLIAGVLFGHVELDQLIEQDMIRAEGTAHDVEQMQRLLRPGRP